MHKIITKAGRSSNFLKLEVSLKGKDLDLRDFEWNDSNYASHPGCFVASQDHTVHSLTNFIYWNRIDSVFPFYTLIRTRTTNNDMEFLIKVFDLNGKLIGQFPASGDSYKAKIPSLRVPILVADTIKLKK